MTETHLGGRVVLHAGDCLAVLRTLPENSVDSVVTDPPYGLEFMGREWDHGVPGVPYWTEALRVLKPGGHIAAFGGTRTYHRMAVAIEDSGFEIRDQLGWVYAQGFPKSHSVPLAIDKAAGHGPRGKSFNTKGGGDRAEEFAENGREHPPAYEAVTDAARQWQGWGTALKPAWEPICLARKPLSEGTVAANVLRWGTGAINIDGCRVGTEQTTTLRNGNSGGNGAYGRDERTFERLNPPGRWPANIVHDGSDEVVACFPDSNGTLSGGDATPRKIGASTDIHGTRSTVFHDDSGSAARFFYAAKADSNDRFGARHPTVKPVDLMRWLARLITPPGGVCLDPFAGTGTTGEAAFLEGFSAILIEREAEHQADIRRRMAYVLGGPDERRHAIVKARGKTQDAGPLFAGLEAAE